MAYKVFLSEEGVHMVSRNGLTQTADEFNNTGMPGTITINELEAIFEELKALGWKESP